MELSNNSLNRRKYTPSPSPPAKEKTNASVVELTPPPPTDKKDELEIPPPSIGTQTTRGTVERSSPTPLPQETTVDPPKKVIGDVTDPSETDSNLDSPSDIESEEKNVIVDVVKEDLKEKKDKKEQIQDDNYTPRGINQAFDEYRVSVSERIRNELRETKEEELVRAAIEAVRLRGDDYEIDYLHRILAKLEIKQKSNPSPLRYAVSINNQFKPFRVRIKWASFFGMFSFFDTCRASAMTILKRIFFF